MIDLDQLRQLQITGAKEIDDLTQLEQDALIGYSALAAEDCLKDAQARRANTRELVTNAFRQGMCLGLEMQIENAQVKER